MVDTIYLKADELKLFKFLKSRSSDSSLWPSLEEIQKNLELSKPNARKLVKSLREKEGIEICSSVGGFGKNKKVSYGLSPEDLDILVTIDNAQQNNEKQKPNEVYSALYLAEPAFGTKAFDDKYTMKGLALFLETNKFSPDLQEVIIQGGVIPHIPPYYSKGYANDLKFLGKIKRNGERTSLSETLLEDRIENEFERNFYVKHINDPERKKITNLTDAFSAAEEQISILMNTLPEDSVLRIQFGEEDRKNIEHLEVAQIKNWAKEKAEQIEGMSKELKEEVEELYNNSFSTIVQKHYLASYLQNPKLVKKSNEKRADYYKRAGEFFKEDKLMSEISNFWKDFGKFVSNDKEEQEGLIEEDSNDLLKDAVEDAVKYVFWAGKNPEKIKQKFEKVNNDFSNLEIEKRNLKSKLDDLSNSFTWTDSLLNSGSVDVTWFTKQYPVFADELEFGFKKVKDKYSGHFFKWKIGQPVVVHVSPRKNVKIDTGIIENLSNGEKSIAEIDYEIVSNGKKNILLVHNLNHIFSDNVSPSTIKDAKLEMNYENIVLNKLFEEEFKGKTPDIVLLGGHHSGGFRVMPWFKKSEQLIEGEFVKNQDISYLINLPTLQDIRKLEWLVEKGFRNWHTKNYQKGPYASGAVLHSETKDGVNRFTMIDTSLLMKFGKIAEEIEVYREQLKQDLSEENRNKILELIKERKESVKLNLSKIEAAGDFHLGAPDNLDRYSKDQFIKASQIYQLEHGLPNIVSWDEIAHGTMERTFNSASRYEGLIPEKFKQVVIDKILASDLTGEQKAYEIAKESMRNLRAITIHNNSEQKHLFKLLLKPYADKILENNGKLILTSGNHFNKSNPTSDEALEFANQFSEEYIDNGQIAVFSGKGNDVGVGALRLDNNQKIFVMHKFPERNDEIYGIMTHLRKMNNDADIVIAGDRHHPGAGYADGHFIALHPGYEPINKFVPLIGKPAGVRGFNNVFYDSDKKGVYAVEFVLNPTLEKIIEKEKII